MALDIQFISIIAGSAIILAVLVKLMNDEANKPQWREISSGVRQTRDKKENT
jgi:hypothetical protein